MSDKSALQRVLDLVVFAPAGLAITVGEEFPKLADKGRHRVEGQVHTARLVGQFAVQFGRQKMEEWAGPAASKAASAVGGAVAGGRGGADAEPAAAGRGAPGPAGEEAGVGRDGSVAAEAAARGTAAPAAPAGANGYAPGKHLAIPGYDSLSASQVVQRLDGLSDTELEEVRAHELASRRRRTILSRVEQLLATSPPGPA